MRLPEKCHRRCAIQAALLLVCAHAASGSGPRFVMQYFYDQDKTEIHFIDLKFPSAKNGMAAGIITDGKKSDPAVVKTVDGGAHWSVQPLKDPFSSKDTPLSLFFTSAT